MKRCDGEGFIFDESLPIGFQRELKREAYRLSKNYFLFSLGMLFLSIVLLLVCMASCCLSVLLEQLSGRLLLCGLALTITLLLEIRLWRWWNAFDFLKTRKISIPCHKCHSTSLCALHADSSRLQKELGMSDEIRGVSIYCKKCDITLLTFWWLLPN